MDDRTQIRGETSTATLYGGLSVNDLGANVVTLPSLSNGSASGVSRLDDSPLIYGENSDIFFCSC